MCTFSKFGVGDRVHRYVTVDAATYLHRMHPKVSGTSKKGFCMKLMDCLRVISPGKIVHGCSIQHHKPMVMLNIV